MFKKEAIVMVSFIVGIIVLALLAAFLIPLIRG